MRVTNQMIIDRTIANLGRNASRFMRLQGMVSTGRAISTASDDPVGTHHDLSYRGRLTEMAQYKANISQGMGWLGSYENGLADLKNLYTASKEIAVTMANDTYDEVARLAAANEIESILQQVLQVANGDIDGRYVFSGHMTQTKPLESSATGVVYTGDMGKIDLEIDTGARIMGNLIGNEIFLKQLSILGEDADLNAGLTGATLVADLNLGNGIQQTPGTFQIFDRNRNITYAIDVSAATTVTDIVNAVNAQLGAAGNLTLQIADAGSSLEWVPVTPPSNSITLTTPLSNLNGGTGVDFSSGRIRIRNDDSSTSFEVDLSSALTVGDVVTTLDTALAAHGLGGTVTVGLNAANNGLLLTDTTGTLGLTIEEVSPYARMAATLGIDGRIDPMLVGRDLQPRPDFQISDIAGQTTAADLGLGSAVNHRTIGTALQPRLTVTTTLASLNNLSGFTRGELKIMQGSQTAIIDLAASSISTIGDLIAAINSSGLEIRASINAAGTGVQITPIVDDKSLMVVSADDSGIAQTLGVEGSSDMIGSLMLLAQALRTNDRHLTETLNKNMDQSIQELLSVRATIGARISRMETTQNRLEASEVNVTRLLSEVEDADMITLVSELAKEENLYKAALVASSRLIQQSLLDFLR